MKTEEKVDHRGLIQRLHLIGGRKFWITELTADEADEFMRVTLATQMATVDDAQNFLDQVQSNPEGRPRNLGFLQQQLAILLRCPDDGGAIPTVDWIRANASNRQISEAVRIQEELNDLPGWCSNFTKSLELLTQWLKMLEAELVQTRGSNFADPLGESMESSRAKFIAASVGAKSSKSGGSPLKSSGSRKQPGPK